MSERNNDRTASNGGRRRDDEPRGRGQRTSEQRGRTDRGRTGNRRRGRGDRGGDDRSGRGRQSERGTAPPGWDRAGEQGGGPPDGPGGGKGASGGDDSGRVSLGRREFLLGGAGAAGLAAGGWWFFLRGPDGAKAVIADLYEALDQNDWAAVDQLMHEDSRLAREIESREDVDSYREYLDDLGGLERQRNTDYTVMGLHEMDHITDPGEELQSFTSQERDVSELKDILAVVERDTSDWDERRDDRDPVSVMDNRLRVALNGNGEWKLW
jgi:hypothetical protein